MPMEIRLTHKQKELLLAWTCKQVPVEVCGALFGIKREEATIVKRVVAIPNILDSSSSFQVDPEKLYHHIMKAERDSIELVGFFHSHPSSPEPSAIDLKYMRFWPSKVWLIISQLSGVMKAYKMDNDSIVEVETVFSNSFQKNSG